MKEMSMEEHLGELRQTLFRVIIILFISFLACYSFGEWICEILLYPLRNAFSMDGTNSGKIVYLGIFDKILSQFQVAFWSSIIVSSPLWFYQLWKFIKPALHDHEIKVIRPFIFAGALLFIIGVTFGQLVVFPFTFNTLLNYGVENVEATISLKDYLILCSKLLVMLGIMFQVPNILLILGFMGVVTKYSLKKMRPYIYLALLCISALLTPPDVLTQLGLWGPLVILFELGVLAVGLIVHPYLARKHMSENLSPT